MEVRVIRGLDVAGINKWLNGMTSSPQLELATILAPYLDPATSMTPLQRAALPRESHKVLIAHLAGPIAVCDIGESDLRFLQAALGSAAVATSVGATSAV